MISKRSKILDLLIAVVILVSLATSGAIAASKVKITIWHAYSPETAVGKILKNMGDQFGIADPGIIVEFKGFPGVRFWDKINVAAASGTLPDIISMDAPLVAEYAYKGVIVPLDKYYTEKNLDDFLDGTRGWMTWDGHVWVAPHHDSTVAVYYNQEIFDQAGITAPRTVDKAWTWDELLDVAKKMTKDIDGDGKTDIWALTGFGWGFYMNEADTFADLPWIWQNNGEVLSPNGTTTDGYLNGPAAVEALQIFTDFFRKYKVVPLERIAEGFETGKVAMEYATAGSMPRLERSYPDLKWGVMPVPYRKRKAVANGAWGLSITSQSKHPGEAARVVDWYTGVQGAQVWHALSHNLSPRKSMFAVFPDIEEYPVSVFAEQLRKISRPRPLTPAYSTLTTFLIKAFADAARGEDPKTALNKAVKEIDRALARISK